MEKFGCFKFKIYKPANIESWSYQIFNEDDSLLRESQELFAYEGIARFAAFGHIALLEQQKG
jgi:hypothetical protein